jgi:ATP-dependent DNA helicase RecQ
LPQAKLVIEIDGQQHKYDEVTRLSDSIRDKYLEQNGIKTVRIKNFRTQKWILYNKN